MRRGCCLGITALWVRLPGQGRLLWCGAALLGCCRKEPGGGTRRRGSPLSVLLLC